MSSHPAQPHERHQHAPEPETAPASSERADRTETPEAVQAARISRPGSDTSPTGASVSRVRGVEWVRPTDLMARHGAALAGRGIDFEVELARRTRSLPAQAVRAGRRRISDAQTVEAERARRLPPVSDFGRSGGSQSWVTRSGIGLR
ncbi:MULTISPECIES: hypothetical protein [unclassified Arthrobacter]|uniref:hypothetical protein n=1 Tax=unclassified Arthrobacter TaxID=235627 RepID=UPI00149288A2|nr:MULTISPECIES: hypothetical protein [unclassified Arthrobacter]MBE0009923.1 hypothetical protein [Arthrobacter sp. AET 35A]NOJ63736.1 hypothetical protein [Arthrobacter sp. 147(2020)]